MSDRLDRMVGTLATGAKVLRRDGGRAVAGRALSVGSERLLSGTRPVVLDVRAEDVLAPALPPTPGIGSPDDAALVINWVTNPPSEHSGGMSTLMRSVSLLEARGHDCRVYARYQGLRRDLEGDRRAVSERRPAVRAEVHDAAEGLRPAHAVFATSWPTAYFVRSQAAPGARFYLVQDHEPWFYPAGSNAALAEQTYRFGFHGITAGRWLTTMLEETYGMAGDGFDLGVDLDTYRVVGEERRDAVVFFSRLDTARRGSELGLLALQLFSQDHPEIEIHIIGDQLRASSLPFAFTGHGHLPGEQVAELYNRCRAGLVLSLTNLSLLPAELLAAGCRPVMNDAAHTRAACDSPLAVFASPEPRALADALSGVFAGPEAGEAAEAAASVEARSWDLVGDQIEAGVRRGLRRAEEATRPGLPH